MKKWLKYTQVVKAVCCFEKRLEALEAGGVAPTIQETVEAYPIPATAQSVTVVPPTGYTMADARAIWVERLVPGEPQVSDADRVDTLVHLIGSPNLDDTHELKVQFLKIA